MEIERKSLNDEEDGLDENQGRLSIRGRHHQCTFSYEEVNALIEGVLFSRTLDTKTANQLVGKIEENLTTRFYKKGPKNICTVRETVLGKREHLWENLLSSFLSVRKGVCS